MDQITDIGYLASVAGAAAVASLAVTAAKQLFAGSRPLWRMIALVFAMAAMFAGTAATGDLTWQSGTLAAINGLVAFLVATGGYDLAAEARGG